MCRTILVTHPERVQVINKLIENLLNVPQEKGKLWMERKNCCLENEATVAPSCFGN